MTTIDDAKIRTEWLNFLRNSDIFTTTQRGVVTTNATGTFSGDTELVINVSDVKNIRSVEVATVTLTYGQDYDIELDYDDAGTIKCRITFNSAQTGSYDVEYDYGTDKIYPDFPRPDVKLSSFPRIGFDFIVIPTESGGFGNVDVSQPEITTIVYDRKTSETSRYVNLIRTAIRSSATSFYYLGLKAQIIAQGPILKAEREVGKDKVFQKNIDVRGLFNYEK